MLKITEMNYHRQQSLASKAQDHISVGGSDSDDGSSVGSSYVGDLPYLESSKSTRTTFYPGKKGSPPSSPTNETMAITGKRTSMFEAKDRLQIKSPTTKNYLSPKNLPQSNLTYGRGSYRKSMRSSMISKSSEDQLAPPTSSLSSELQEWLNSVMNLNPSVGSNRSIDLSSERRTPDRPSSRGGGISLSSLGSSEVRLSTFTPKPLNNTFLSDDDDDPVEGTESTPSNNQLRSSPIQSEPTSPVLLYPDYQTENGSHSSLKYGVFGGSWDPKRAKIFKRRKQQPESIKLKITREVAKSRAKYKIPDYTSEAIRGKNPLIPPELREPVKGDDGVDIVELLSETMKKEKKLKKIPPASTTRATTPSRPLTSNPLGTLITGLSLTTPASLSTSHQQKITPPTLLTVQAQSQESSTNTLNPFFLTETSQQQVNEPKKSPKVLPTSSLPPSFHESQYYLDSSEKKLSTMTDTVTPEVYIVSKSHPSLTNIGSLPSLHVASSTSSHGKTSSQIIQPHAAYPFSTYGPWIPNGGMGVMISDKSDPLMSWEENRDVLKYCPYDNTEIRTVLKRQNIIRNSFEGYAKKQPNFTISTSSIPS